MDHSMIIKGHNFPLCTAAHGEFIGGTFQGDDRNAIFLLKDILLIKLLPSFSE